MQGETGSERATCGGGCFWCLEPVFQQLRGVRAVHPGYAGGHTANPTYEEVCSGTSGHAEVVEITFDPEEISYGDLLTVFFAVHDPTTPHRQGADIGEQYRSVIFYHSDEQRRSAEEAVAALAMKPEWEGSRVVTEVAPLAAFYPAEDYHRDYFRKNPDQPYCRIVIAPKLGKFKQAFRHQVAD